MNGVGLRGDHTASQIYIVRQSQVSRGVRLAVVGGEIDYFIALIGDRHAGNNCVIVARDQIGDNAVPIVHNPFTGQFGAFAQFVADFALKTVDFAGIIDKVPRRVSTFSAQAHGVARIGQSGGQGQGGCG